MTQRRYDIDWLRTIAIFILIVYHLSIGFQPWGLMLGFIQNTESMEGLWLLMAMINVWRIPLLFFVSGMGVYFSLRNRNWLQLTKERFTRIFIPYVFGILFIVPIHVLILQNYYKQQITYAPSSGHLWFLGNILIYTLIFLLLFLFLKRNEHQLLGLKIKNFVGGIWGILTLVILYVLESLLVNPGNFELYAETWHGFFLGLISFLFGFLFIYSGKAFWDMICAKRWLFLILGFAFYGVRLLYFELQAPNFLKSIESITWILALFGFGFKHLNKPSKLLAYLSKSAYPVYIIHMAILYLVSQFIFPLEISAISKFAISLLLTVLGSLFIYEFVIKRVVFLRIAFGLKKSTDEKSLAPYSKNQSVYEYGK